MRIIGASVLLAATAALCPPAAFAAPVGCGSLGGVVAEGVCRVAEDQPAFTIDAEFPLDYPDEQAIVGYLSQTRDGLINAAQGPGARNLPYELNVTSESLRSAKTRSVVLTLFENVGSAHPTTWYKAFTYDVDRGRPVTFDSLFAPGSSPLQTIFPIVARELETRTGLVGSISEDDGMDPAHYQNFAVTDDAVTFYFGRAELLPSYAGATSVAVPRNAVPPLQL